MTKYSSLIVLIFSTVFLAAQGPDCSHRKSSVTQPVYASASNDRSDTIDILKYTINLEITDFTNKIIKGNTVVKFTPKLPNVNVIHLDLLKLTIDSIKIGNVNLFYTYNDTILSIPLTSLPQLGDTLEIMIAYRGTPKVDASGWGGFYFQSGYAFNLGVGFAADPHNYGRVWFPCFDNFVERSKYEFNISTNAGKVAYCNGYLASDTSDASGLRTRKWIMNEEIPTYLASVAVAGYTHVSKDYSSINGTVPGMLTAVPTDTTNLKNSFVNLQGALTRFENSFGPYLWNRIGFCLVPFSSGAMEHATNISYPRNAVNGLLTYETLMAHEFAHHWWGDLVTCRTQEDMWINEGMATYSEHLFLEGIYGRSNYNTAVRSNHEEVVRYLHAREGGYRAISGVPHAYTYSDHVYKKGASVAHSMRGYLGDSLYFAGLKSFLSSNIRKDVDSYDFMNAMEAVSSTAGISMTDFFTDWVFNPGFPHFSIDSSSTVSNGSQYSATVFFKQKLRGAPSFYNNVPIDITVKNMSSWQEETRRVQISGESGQITLTNLSVKPDLILIDRNDLLNDALVAEERIIKASGAHNLPLAKWNMTVNNLSDSAFVRVEHNYVAPDSILSQGSSIKISRDRFWRVDGILPANFLATVKITYDGRNVTGGGSGQLDNTLITTSEDSLVLLYRPDRKSPWSEYPYYVKSPGTNLNDKFGSITLDSMRLGEYTLGMKAGITAISVNQLKIHLNVTPNPANNQLILNTSSTQGAYEIFDINGKLQLSGSAFNGHSIDISKLECGTYFLKFKAEKESATVKFIKI